MCVDYVNKLNKSLVLRCIVCYRPPVSNLHEMSEFCSLLCNLSDGCKNMLLLGDFNLPHINWSLCIPTVGDSLYDIFLTTVLKLNLFQHVSMPIRGENYLDFILSSEKNLIENVSRINLISDHYLISADLVVQSTPMNITNKRQWRRDFTKTDFDAFHFYLHYVKWYTIFAKYPDVDSKWNAFSEILNFGINIYVPLAKVKSTTRRFSYPSVIKRLILRKR